MRPAWRAGGPAPRFLAAVAALAAVLAGCGTVRAPGSPPGGTTAPARTRGSGPHAGSRAEGLTLARQILSRLVLPPGARSVRPAPPPEPLRQPGVPAGAVASVDLHDVYSLRQPMPAVYGFLMAHVPAGMQLTENGQGGGPADVTMQTVGYAPRSLPSGIYRAEMATAVVPAAGGSLLRADAQVIWYPSRSAAEYLNPAAFRKATISVTLYGQRRPHAVTRAFTSPAVISRLAGLLNRMPAMPTIGAIACPAIWGVHRIEFAASATSRPGVVVTATRWSCVGDRMTVNGEAQPTLQDPGKLTRIADRLLGVVPGP